MRVQSYKKISDIRKKKVKIKSSIAFFLQIIWSYQKKVVTLRQETINTLFFIN